MSQQIQEQLSALMDGELPRDETMFLLRRIDHERGLLNRWSDFHVVRQALRRQEILPLRSDFAALVMQGIESAPAPVAARTRPWLRLASGGAIAASVAVAVLVATAPREIATPEGQPLVVSPASTTPVASTRPDSGITEFRPPMLSPSLAAQPASVTTSGFNASSAPLDPRLQSYLIRHYDATGGAGQSASLPYMVLIVPPQAQAANASASQGSAERR